MKILISWLNSTLNDNDLQAASQSEIFLGHMSDYRGQAEIIAGQ